MCYLRSSFNKQ